MIGRIRQIVQLFHYGPLGANCVSVLLDMTMAPLQRWHYTQKGNRIGLHVFSKAMAKLDRLLLYPSQYLRHQPRPDEVEIGQSEIERYLIQPVVSYLRMNGLCDRQRAFDIAGLMGDRAYRIVFLYNEAIARSRLAGLNAVQTLCEIQREVWTYACGSCCTGQVIKLPISGMADQISAALHLIRGEIWFERFLENELANKLLAGELKEGDTVLIDVSRDKLTFTGKAPAKVAA